MNRADYEFPIQDLHRLGLLACERLFFLYRRFEDGAEDDFRQRLDDLRRLDPASRGCTEEDFAADESFVEGWFGHVDHRAEFFLTALTEMYRFAATRNPYWIFSIEETVVAAIEEVLAACLYERLEEQAGDEEVRDFTPEEEAQIANAPPIRRERVLRGELRELLRAGADAGQLAAAGIRDPLEEVLDRAPAREGP